MTINSILKANNIQELKKLGSYLELKLLLEKEVDNKLGIKSWVTLFNKIKFLKCKIRSKNNILLMYENNSFSNVKEKISKYLEVSIKANNEEELKEKIRKFVHVFSCDIFDPISYYEKTKYKKFRDSCKLEGIDIEISNNDMTLESVVEKYKHV